MRLPKQKDQILQRAFLIDRLAPRRGERILDLGCGFGQELEHILRYHPTVRTVGLDSSQRMIDAARRRLSRYAKTGRVELVVGDAGEKLPFPSKHFHAVLSIDLIECLPPAKRTQLLQEIRRVLKPGGRVLVEHTDWDTHFDPGPMATIGLRTSSRSPKRRRESPSRRPDDFCET